MIGIGAANLAAGFFQGFPVSTSGSRTAVAEQAGARSPAHRLVGRRAHRRHDPRLLPGPAPEPPAAGARCGRHRRVAVARRHRRHRAPLAAAQYRVLPQLAAFLGVALLGVLPGIAVAVALSILNVFRRAWWPYQTVLGRVGRSRAATTTCAATRTPSSCRGSWSTGSTPRCSSRTRGPSGTTSGAGGRRPAARWIIVAAEPITDVDTTAADMLEDLDARAQRRGISARLRRDEGPGSRRRSSATS